MNVVKIIFFFCIFVTLLLFTSFYLNTDYYVESNSYDLGDIKKRENNIANFNILNKGKNILYVKNIESDCDCNIVRINRKFALPGESIIVTARYKGNTQGFFQRLIIVRMNIKGRFLLLKVIGKQY